MSGQIAINPEGIFIAGGVEAQTRQVFENLAAIALAAGGNVNQCVKLTVFLTDLTDAAVVNDVIKEYFNAHYPARSMVEVSALPRGACVEIEAILSLR